MRVEEGARGSPKSGDKDAALLLDTLEQAVEMVRLRQAMVLVYAALLGSSAAPDLLDLASQVLPRLYLAYISPISRPISPISPRCSRWSSARRACPPPRC